MMAVICGPSKNDAYTIRQEIKAKSVVIHRIEMVCGICDGELPVEVVQVDQNGDHTKNYYIMRAWPCRACSTVPKSKPGRFKRWRAAIKHRRSIPTGCPPPK